MDQSFRLSCHAVLDIPSIGFLVGLIIGAAFYCGSVGSWEKSWQTPSRACAASLVCGVLIGGYLSLKLVHYPQLRIWAMFLVEVAQLGLDAIL